MRTKFFLLVTTILFSHQVTAQDEAQALKYGPDKDLCEQNLSIYIEFYKQKNYKDDTSHGLICLIMHLNEQRTYITRA